jgi:hypothetical protein
MRRALVVLFCVHLALAKAQETRARRGTPRPESGRVLFQLDFAASPPVTVEDLLSESTLIVDGRVIAVLPSLRLKPSFPLQTASLVLITEVLSGTIPSGWHTIGVSQFGGKIGALEEVFEEDQIIMAAGERYLFFLQRNTCSSPKAENYLTYCPAGSWVGKARVENGTISFPPHAHGGGLTPLNGSDATSFLSLVRQKIAEHLARQR